MTKEKNEFLSQSHIYMILKNSALILTYFRFISPLKIYIIIFLFSFLGMSNLSALCFGDSCVDQNSSLFIHPDLAGEKCLKKHIKVPWHYVSMNLFDPLFYKNINISWTILFYGGKKIDYAISFPVTIGFDYTDYPEKRSQLPKQKIVGVGTDFDLYFGKKRVKYSIGFSVSGGMQGYANPAKGAFKISDYKPIKGGYWDMAFLNGISLESAGSVLLCFGVGLGVFFDNINYRNYYVYYKKDKDYDASIYVPFWFKIGIPIYSSNRR